jgi:hypothetical protein
VGGKDPVGDGPGSGGLYGSLAFPQFLIVWGSIFHDFPVPQKNASVYDLYSCIRHKTESIMEGIKEGRRKVIAIR